MKLVICSVLDRAISAYNAPMFFRTRMEAIRSFSDAVNSGKDQNFSRHPEDYFLMFHGEFDDATGVFTATDTPERVVSAVECVGQSAASQS